MIKYELDKNVKQINMFDERWYRIKDIDLPSVTTYLEVYPKGYQFNKWLMETKDPYQVRDEAAQLGSAVHGLIEKTLKGETIEYYEEMDIKIWERYLYWCNFWKALFENPTKTLTTTKIKQSEIIEIVTKEDFTEYITYDLEEKTAGTVDKLIRINYADGNTKYAIIDWKTGKNLYESAKLQVAAYAKMTEKQYKVPIDFAIIVQLNESLNKGGYRVAISTIEDINNDYLDFLNVKQIWLREHKNEKPKYRTYPTTINLDYIKNNEIIKEV
uniref:Putative PD-(D/E)XK nuclease superfamily protein n=1 Tax=viral metagenome TaxID=1070528 RepID=A0A6H2A4S5_9ZZZZ